MMDSVKDSLNVDQDGTHIAIPGTPKSNQSQNNGEGLAEDLKFISGNSSGRAIEEREGTKKPLDQSGKYFAMNSVEDEDAESDFTSGATLIRERTAEALERLHKQHSFERCCSICDADKMFPLNVSCQVCGEFPSTHHSSCCETQTMFPSGNIQSKNRKFEERWQQAESHRQTQEHKGRAKQQQQDYEERLMKIFDQKTESMRKEQQVIKDENDSLRDMIRSKCAITSELLVSESTAGTPHDMLIDLGLKAATESILVHARTLYPDEPIKAAELVAESVKKITLQLAGNPSGNAERKPFPPNQETYAH